MRREENGNGKCREKTVRERDDTLWRWNGAKESKKSLVSAGGSTIGSVSVLFDENWNFQSLDGSPKKEAAMSNGSNELEKQNETKRDAFGRCCRCPSALSQISLHFAHNVSPTDFAAAYRLHRPRQSDSLPFLKVGKCPTEEAPSPQRLRASRSPLLVRARSQRHRPSVRPSVRMHSRKADEKTKKCALAHGTARHGTAIISATISDGSCPWHPKTKPRDIFTSSPIDSSHRPPAKMMTTDSPGKCIARPSSSAASPFLFGILGDEMLCDNNNTIGPLVSLFRGWRGLSARPFGVKAASVERWSKSRREKSTHTSAFYSFIDYIELLLCSSARCSLE